ncbi:hypothetical protein NM208_g958 [Fusarium decemcellulare]|uniref:Uncharacterized protein n=1 Tax=Fusarium decemcellulare TaxID=57161 RepID=A0ACC1SY20_9HYPO|nr:hypothetical protein NM208_g958 [Fusarium decemcellulare]
MPVHLADEWLAFEASIGCRPRMTGKSVLEIRNAVARMTKKPTKDTPGLKIHESVIDDSPHGIKVRIYEPLGQANILSPDVALFFHGGGWCVGDLDLEDDLVRLMAVESNMRFVSVDYRLGPENPWPAQLDDCRAAVQWARQANGNTTRVFLVGASAGAQLSLSVAAGLSQTDCPIAGVVALAPFTVRKEDALQYIGQQPISHLENEDAPILTMEVLQMFLDAARAPIGDHTFSVLLSPYLSSLPPTYLVVCGADILRDHGRLLAEELRKHSIPLKIDEYLGYPHTFWATPNLKIIDDFF